MKEELKIIKEFLDRGHELTELHLKEHGNGYQFRNPLDKQKIEHLTDDDYKWAQEYQIQKRYKRVI